MDICLIHLFFTKKYKKVQKGYTKGKLLEKSWFFQNFDFFTKNQILPFFYPFFGGGVQKFHTCSLPPINIIQIGPIEKKVHLVKVVRSQKWTFFFSSKISFTEICGKMTSFFFWVAKSAKLTNFDKFSQKYYLKWSKYFLMLLMA